MTYYDYIVVGGGSAGVALAARLAEDARCSILLLEAGPSTGGFWTRMPLGLAKALLNESILWSYQTEAEQGLGGRSAAWLSGKVLGGSSAVNGMIFVRGHPSRYDLWGDAGCPGWHFEDVLPYFRQLENCRFSRSAARGYGGPISVERYGGDRLTNAFVESCVHHGLPYVDDYNDQLPDGVSLLQLSTKRGVRADTAHSYLAGQTVGPNLHVRSRSTARRVLFRNRCANAVEYEVEGQILVAYANREVILCAGAIRTPQLLELSGIGDPELLRRHAIPIVHPNSSVGENLQDHLMTRITYECTQRITINDLLRSNTRLGLEFLRYLVSRRGMFATPSLTATAYVRSSANLSVPDIRIQIGLTSSEGRLASGRYGGTDPFPGFHIGSYPLYPSSRGATHIATTDVHDAPKIRAGYLLTEGDVSVSLRGLEITRALSGQKPLRDLIAREVRPGANVGDVQTLANYVRATGHTCWHPVGTCRMGSGPDAVVSADLRVRGVENLRVADASVIPFQVSSNTNIPAIMIGERAAAFIRSRRSAVAAL